MAQEEQVDISDLTAEQLCTVLRSRKPPFDEEVIEVFRKNKISGGVLLDILEDDELQQLGVEAYGDRKRIKKMVAQRTVVLASPEGCQLQLPKPLDTVHQSTPSEYQSRVGETVSLRDPTTNVSLSAFGSDEELDSDVMVSIFCAR